MNISDVSIRAFFDKVYAAEKKFYNLLKEFVAEQAETDEELEIDDFEGLPDACVIKDTYTSCIDTLGLKAEYELYKKEMESK